MFRYVRIAWGCILYSVMEFSNASSLPYWMRPILDGLLALNIDLVLDRSHPFWGFWDWGQGLKFQYFGVPYANFWGGSGVHFLFLARYRILPAAKTGLAYGSHRSRLHHRLAGVLERSFIVLWLSGRLRPSSLRSRWRLRLFSSSHCTRVLSDESPFALFWIPSLHTSIFGCRVDFRSYP